MPSFNEYFDTAFWVLQAVVGLVFFAHGLGKVKAPAGVAAAYGAPAFVGLVHGLVEVVGGVMMVTDWMPQLAAAAFCVIMLGALYFKIFKWKSPFLVMDKAGWEFDLLLLAASLLILTK